MNNPITKGAVERVARLIEPYGWQTSDQINWSDASPSARELQAKCRQWQASSLVKAEAILTTLNLGELVTALEGLNTAVDAMWNDSDRIQQNKIAGRHVTAILAAQAEALFVLTRLKDPAP